MRSLEAELEALRLRSENSPDDEPSGGMSRETLAPIFDDPDQGLSNKEFAAAIGVDPSTVSRYRRGITKTPDEIAAQWEYRESDQRWHRKDHN